MKKNYTMTLEIVSPEEIDLHEVNELLNGKGSFVIQKIIFGKYLVLIQIHFLKPWK